MTAAKCTESSQRSRSSVRELLLTSEHDAPNETATMSSHGPREPLPITSTLPETSTDQQDLTRADKIDVQTQTSDSYLSSLSEPNRSGHDVPAKPPNRQARKAARRIQFDEFAEQLRLQQYFEGRKHLLRQRKRVLQKTVTLSARLHRIGSWVGDGLVEISSHTYNPGFARVHQHFQNLTDLSYSQWDQELRVLDPLGQRKTAKIKTARGSGTLARLSSSVQADLFELLTLLRSSPRFLAERFRILQPAQIVALWNPPRSQGSRLAAESQYGSFTQTPTRAYEQRMGAFTKSLEEYTSSLERQNPLSFLLFNVYGTDQSSTDAENQLRLSTWSKVCAELMLTSERAYQSLIIPLLDRFASLYEWRARDCVELFLMDTIQRGSFLLDPSPENRNARRFAGYDPMKTPEARRFFDTAVRDLFTIFVQYDGGFPSGALQFASAMLDKLPGEQQQKDFRGTFFSSWFIDRFLQTMINFPENENMLLKFHISKGARQKILHQLYLTVHESVHDVFQYRPIRPVDPEFRDCVLEIIGWVASVKSSDPYVRNDNIPEQSGAQVEPSITISVSEVVQMLEAISPQTTYGVGSYDQLLHNPGSFTTFHSHFTLANRRFDLLKTDLLSLMEPGSSVIDVHPCQEQWLQIDIDESGRPKALSTQGQKSDSFHYLEGMTLDGAQQAVLRLVKEQMADLTALGGSTYRSDLLKQPSLDMLFREMATATSAKLDPIGCSYWNKARDTLLEKYPLSILVQDDTAVLQRMLDASQVVQTKCREYCSNLEIQLSSLEDTCLRIRTTINRSIDRFDSLRLKLWYFTDVVLSNHYDNAKNVAKALNHMATSSVSVRSQNLNVGIPFRNGRPMSARSVASSTFEQPYAETMNMIKAPSSQGGPMKLADKQIELTNNWLDLTHIEKFCRGEERIHRFCMEIYNVSRRLVGESMSESPVLWASDLYQREKGLFNVQPYTVTSAPASTRPASLFSDLSGSQRSSRTSQHVTDSLRMVLIEDRRMNTSNRNVRDVLPAGLPPGLASSLGSLSRSHSATTAESASSVFSPHPSTATRSMTSASIHSRSASMFNESSLSHYTDTSRQKAKFLEKMHRDLICLLLSDLGCPVWTMGSETDAMLKSSHETPAVNERLRQRMIADRLVDKSKTNAVQQSKARSRPRSRSVSTLTQGSQISPILENHFIESQRQYPDEVEYEHWAGLSGLLAKLGQQVDPMEKIAVIEEFYNLSLTRFDTDPVDLSDGKVVSGAPRRSSLDVRAPRSSLTQQSEAQWTEYPNEQNAQSLSAHQVVQHLKSDLARLRPRTLFRDLQYISAFVPTEYIDNTRRGKALLQLGLAALAYKDEVCRSMVDVADKMLSQTQDAQSQPQVMQQVAKFWMYAAREGNPVAQRELALLYLSQSKLLPVISLPLFPPSQIFEIDILWHERNKHNTDTQALCLALHWLQQASDNGDRLAKQKLEQRQEGISIQ